MPITDYDGQLQTIARNLGEEPELTTTDGLLEAIAKGTENIITEDELDDYLPLSGGTITGTIVDANGSNTFIVNSADNLYTQINGGTEQSKGAWLRLNGKDNVGSFQIRANDGTNEGVLIGKPDETLTWGGKNVERVNASGTNYIRYVSGLQICFASVGNMSASTTITFPVPFIDVPFIVSGTNSSSANSSVTALTASGFTANMETYDHAYRYIAIGYWK